MQKLYSTNENEYNSFILRINAIYTDATVAGYTKMIRMQPTIYPGTRTNKRNKTLESYTKEHNRKNSQQRLRMKREEKVPYTGC